MRIGNPAATLVFAGLLLAAGLTPAFAQVGGGPGVGAEERIDAIVAVVEGEPIFESEVEEQLYLFLLQSGAQPDPAMADTLRTEILERLIDEKLIVQEAERRNVTIPDADLDAQVSAALSDAKQRLGGEAGYQAELAREGITEEQLRERYRGEIRRQALANQLLRMQLDMDAEVSEAEAVAYFNEHRDEFPTKPAEYRLALIQVPVTPDSSSTQAAQGRINSALERVRGGESFARVAQEVSEDPGTRQAGGDLGFFGRGVLDPNFEAAAFALGPGEVSDVVQTQFGYHIIRVEEVDTVKGEVHARHILVRVALTPEDEKRAIARAEDIHAKAIGGEDFAILVSRYSAYGGAAGGGGDLGFLPATEFSPEIRAVLDTLRIGGVSPVMPSPQGLVIFKMLDKRTEQPYELEEIRAQLPEFVKRIRLQEQYEEWVSTLRAKANIEMKNR